jgi:valine dehydrogenase (NAD+)
MDLIRRETPHVTGVSESLGGSGDPSPATAWGLLAALRTIGARCWGSPSLEGRHVVVVGVGKVGRALVGHLVADGAKVTVADIDPGAVEATLTAHHGVEVVDVAEAHSVECDVLSPCALGGYLNARTIPELRCRAVCGSANNQLEEPADGQRLADAGVLFAPDFVVSAGGVINIAEERTGHGYVRERAWQRIAGIEATLATVFDRADADGVTPEVAADRVAESRIEAVAGTRRIRTSRPEPTA